MTIMSTAWQQLRLSNEGNLPPLLFKYSPTASGYELYMTDLSYIWSERLDRKAILKRADGEDTTIDPSEDSEQFEVLLQKIGEGLQNGPGSSSILTTKTHDKTQGFELTVTSKLPAPLRPLEWRLHLFREPQSSTTSHLLLPLIRAEGDRAARQQLLIEELGKKDWVLAKLFDKIEAMGIDLSTIFPGTSGLRSGRKGPTLAQAAKYIKGLAPFNEQSWLEEVEKSATDSGLADNIVTAISGQLSQDSDPLQPPPDEWWKNLTVSDSPAMISTPQKSNKQFQQTKPASDAMSTDTDAVSETGDEEFERQETPPRLKKPGAASKAISKDADEETQSEDEDVRPPNRGTGKEKQSMSEQRLSPAMRPKVTATGKSKGFGTNGGKKQAKPKEPSPAPAPSPPEAKAKATSPQTTKHQPFKPPLTENDDGTTDDEPPKTIKANNDTKKTAPRPSRGLGVIGGKKKKEPEPEPELEPELEPETRSRSRSQSHGGPDGGSQSPELNLRTQAQQTQSEPKKKKPLGKLGVIGGSKAKPKANTKPRESISPAPTRKKVEDEENVDKKPRESTPGTLAPADRKAKKDTSAPPEPEHEETEQERADRKREELKRQLEAKSKTPAKKKRRF
ncbi:XRCC4-like factor-domain-containing protein [Aspergillus keveii]|uniref:Non-homologous end-joining factor 1 n=1 Tax=Aspergillus keveii TaxID=714993 RepID=A0ABR4GQK4_9EURO